MNETKLKIALQKSGRLSADSINLLKTCGIGFNDGLGKLRTEAENFPLEIFFLRDDDIPEYVSDGVADIGIVGENVLAETQKNCVMIEKLGFGKCRLSLAVPKSFDYQTIANLNNKRIATSYPNVLSRFLAENNIKAEIHTISGSVEIAPGIGLADAVCDLVSSGSTLFTNGLREVETVLISEAILISRSNLNGELQTILDKLLFRLKAVRAARQNRYILLNAPNDKLQEITALLPGIKSPTVMPLAETGWSSIHSVINENDFWEIVEQLKAKGAEGILVLSIDQMIE
ncbi:MAG: ATP phosphoribosyltransferase [Acidobacteria bacterium]|nr:ATP phosphoribosyltransferase [Acidobacteriota bacterium]MCA1636815.1 ATP phosphoribosyltransferase [Acidobacteriota bacterium]